MFFHRSQTFDMWVCRKNGERPSCGNLKRKMINRQVWGILFSDIHFKTFKLSEITHTQNLIGMLYVTQKFGIGACVLLWVGTLRVYRYFNCCTQDPGEGYESRTHWFLFHFVDKFGGSEENGLLLLCFSV